MRVGSLEWGLETGGVLGDEDRAELMEQLGRAARRLSAPPTYAGPSDFGIDEVVVPDSALAKEAAALCREASDQWLLDHCERSYLFGAGLGIRSSVTFDSEILYVAALLHDLAVTPRYEGTTSDECFAIAGARIALDVGLARATKEIATAAADAISRHLNVDVLVDEGPEAHLLSAAVTMDVAGLGLEPLPKRFVEAALHRHPRGEAREGIAGIIRRQAALHPNTRSGFLNEIGLAQRALDNPLG